MRRSGVGALAASPTMVGAITVLVTILAVFLAYNANNGLPFVPSYRITAQVPNAAALVKGNEVRIGGVRVGLVEGIAPVQTNDGSTRARLDLKLDQDVGPLPVDSTLIVRSRSALGLKYLEINQGSSDKTYPEGSVLPLSSATPTPVEFDEVLSTFDGPTRTAIRQNLIEFGNALAGRGPSVNSALGKLRPALENLVPVARLLSARRTHLARFVRSLSATAAEVAPVAEAQAELFGELDTTFAALGRVARPFIQDTIVETPPTLDTGIRTLPVIRPFLDHSATLFADLRPGVRSLRENAPIIADALEVGTPVLRTSPQLNRELAPTAASLLRFNNDKGVRKGIRKLTDTLNLLHPTLRFITPSQTVCNYPYLFARNASGTLNEGNPLGKWQEFIVFQGPADINDQLFQPNNEVTPSSGPANGPQTANYLHVNPYPNTAAPGQTFECESGNEPYLAGRQVIGNVPGNQGIVTEDQSQKQLNSKPK